MLLNHFSCRFLLKKSAPCYAPNARFTGMDGLFENCNRQSRLVVIVVQISKKLRMRREEASDLQ